jgi:uncharacterized protein YcaQ
MLQLSLLQARRFLLKHQFLLPPRSLSGPQDALRIFERLGCIQYDPVDQVGHNPELVLQSRLANYTPALLNDLLYTSRQLWDGFDKVMSIYRAEDYPYFTRLRDTMKDHHYHRELPPADVTEMVLNEIRTRGPLSSIDIEHEARADWHWGGTRLVRVVLESQFGLGALGIHHRVGTRRFFDLTENLLPESIYKAPDPCHTLEEHQDWHTLRRVGGMGLAHAGAGEHWLGMFDMKAPQRQASLQRLQEQGKLLPVKVEGLERHTFFMRQADAAQLDEIDLLQEQPQMAFIAPLDNLLWHRDRLRWLFDFDYIWEVYKVPEQRKYGYYVLPVLYGERFIARLDPALDRKAKRFTLRNWWWEPDFTPDDSLLPALRQALGQFLAYLGNPAFTLGEAVVNDPVLSKI